LRVGALTLVISVQEYLLLYSCLCAVEAIKPAAEELEVQPEAKQSDLDFTSRMIA
jgi:hypothetical protein